MQLGKNVQIESDLFLDICDYFLNNNACSEDQIRAKLLEKIDKIVEREIFTQYKRSFRNSAEREYYRQQYLDQKGISRNFRTEQEYTEKINPEQP